MARGFRMGVGGGSTYPSYLYLIKDGIAQVPYSGGAIQASNYIGLSRGYNADYKSFITYLDVSKYKTAYCKYTNATNNNGYTVNMLIKDLSVYGVNGEGSGTLVLDISSITEANSYIRLALALNNTSARITEFALIK